MTVPAMPLACTPNKCGIPPHIYIVVPRLPGGYLVDACCACNTTDRNRNGCAAHQGHALQRTPRETSSLTAWIPEQTKSA